MPKSRIILVIGFIIALLPVLGFPHSWESFFQVVGGLGIVLLSVLISIDKRLTQKAKAERRLNAKRAKNQMPPTSNVEETQSINEDTGATQ